MHALTKNLLIGFGSVAMIASTACKQLSSEQAKQNTIENLSRSDVNKLTLNSCGSDTAASTSKESLVAAIVNQAEGTQDANVRDALAKALRGAPEQMLKMFHADINGKIVIDASKANVCANSLSTEEKTFLGEASANTPIACWRADKDAPPHIYLGAGRIANHDISLAANVRHNTVRMLGYVYSQYIPAKLRLRLADIKQARSVPGRAVSDFATLARLENEMQTTLDRFVSNRTALKNALFTDLSRLDSPALARLKSFASSAGERFDDYVLAEAFDSYYCSAGTRKTLGTDTKATAEAFGVFATELGE